MKRLFHEKFYLHLHLHLHLRFSAGLVIRRARQVIICQFKKHFHRALIIHCKILYVKRLTWNFLEIFYFSFQPSRFDRFFGQKKGKSGGKKSNGVEKSQSKLFVFFAFGVFSEPMQRCKPIPPDEKMKRKDER